VAADALAVIDDEAKVHFCSGVWSEVGLGPEAK
jgi:hypothetical protein